MKAVFFLVIVSLSPAFVFSQSPTPTPTPDNDVVRISTNLIRIDVSVTDTKGKAVADLRADEIEIYENGQKQKITGLKFVAGEPSVKEETKETAKEAVPLPPAILKSEQVRRTIALVVDDLTLSFESAYFTRRALKKFVDEQMAEGDLVAIIRTGAGIGALQQFTSDKRVLYAAIERVKWNPIGNGGTSAFAPLEGAPPVAIETPAPEPGERTPEGIQREFDDMRESYFATGTLGALDYVIRGMSELPGRKSVILFSQGFQMLNTDAQGFTEGSATLDPLKRLIDAANRASVVIYSIDSRGLVYTGLTAADNTSGMTREAMQAAVSNRNAQLTDTQDSLRYLAKETGGFALINNNDLSGGVRRVLEDQSYYLVSYEPDDETFDPEKRKFNKLEVKVLRAGARVRYRSGFFNVVDREPAAATTATAGTLGKLEYALVSPFAVSGITLRLNALFGNDAKKQPYVRSLLHVNAADLKFTDEANGQKKAVFEVLAMSFGDNGQPVDQLGKSYTLTIKPEAYKRILAEGFVYHFLFPVKKPGPYQYRVAIRDAQSGKLGSASQFIDVPDLKKKKLTLSSIVIESLTEAAYQSSISAGPGAYQSNAMTDTALRRLKSGTILRCGFEVYNARVDQAKKPHLFARLRIFGDGKLILDGKQTPIELLGQTDTERIAVNRAISFGKSLQAGDYILQVIVTDASDPYKERISSQFVQFEIVN